MSDKSTLLDAYFRDALLELTGCAVPEDARFDCATWGESLLEGGTLQDWANCVIAPEWACGSSLLDAAANFVSEARSNDNIMSPSARYPADFEEQGQLK